jgi:hypothetical protein
MELTEFDRWRMIAISSANLRDRQACSPWSRA